jgi:hypothetical protein
MRESGIYKVRGQVVLLERESCILKLKSTRMIS